MTKRAELPELKPIPESWYPKEGVGDQDDCAYAIGGLGGFNNFNAGALAAAIELDRSPKLIACTSGGIAWTAAYLEEFAKCKTPRAVDSAQRDRELQQAVLALKQKAQEAADSCNPSMTGERLVNDFILAALGIPNVFRPAWVERYRAFIRNNPAFNFFSKAPSSTALVEEFF